eukprot:3802533-Rhodomonas_salina.1
MELGLEAAITYVYRHTHAGTGVMVIPLGMCIGTSMARTAAARAGTTADLVLTHYHCCVCYQARSAGAHCVSASPPSLTPSPLTLHGSAFSPSPH